MQYGKDMSQANMIFHHFGLLSSTPEASRQVLIDLGYDVSGPIEDLLQNVRAYWGCHPALPCVEIISPNDSPGPVSNLATRLQQGIYHLCFEVTDVAACLERLSTHSRVMLVSPPKPAILFQNRQVSFHFVEHLGLVELLEQDEGA
jgi:methylmalonyl-CoA/ethylmalonyl-CoA epimerase